MNCDGCNEHEGSTLISNMANGDTLSLCGACLVAWAVSLTREVDPSLLPASTPDPVPVPDPPPAATDGGSGPGGPPPRGRRRQNTTTESARTPKPAAAN